tara:strand:- start:90 stop:572 length:483 start_codon:yes stop_codon:yes gene_type:complete
MAITIDAEFDVIQGTTALQTTVLDSNWKKQAKDWLNRAMAQILNWGKWLYRMAISGLKWAVKLFVTFYVLPFSSALGQLLILVFGLIYAYGMLVCLVAGKWALMLAVLIEFIVNVTMVCFWFWALTLIGVTAKWLWTNWGKQGFKSLWAWANSDTGTQET